MPTFYDRVTFSAWPPAVRSYSYVDDDYYYDDDYHCRRCRRRSCPKDCAGVTRKAWDKLRSDYDDASGKIKTLKTKNASLRDEVSRLSRGRGCLGRDSICLDDDDDLSILARRRIRQLKSDLESKKAEYLDMKAQKEDFEARVGVLTDTVLLQHRENSTLKRQLDRCASDVAAAERVIHNLRRELDSYPGYRGPYNL
jgi:chromosome segregation ATPase